MYAFLKAVYTLGVVVAAYFAPIQSTLLACLILVAADLVVGVWAAVKRGEAIRSAKLRKTITKLFVYQVALCLGFIGETYLLAGSVPVVKLIAGFVGVTELKSVFENLDSITGDQTLRLIIEKLSPPNVAKNVETAGAKCEYQAAHGTCDGCEKYAVCVIRK